MKIWIEDWKDFCYNFESDLSLLNLFYVGIFIFFDIAFESLITSSIIYESHVKKHNKIKYSTIQQDIAFFELSKQFPFEENSCKVWETTNLNLDFRKDDRRNFFKVTILKVINLF